VKKLLVVISILVVVGAIGCAKSNPTTTAAPTSATPTAGTTAAATSAKPSATAAPTTTQVKVPTGTVTIAVPSLDTEKFLPWLVATPAMPLFEPVYDFLIQVDPKTDQLVPSLATDWTMTPDGKTWTLHLRKGVQFQGGYGEFTSADAAFSITNMYREDSKGGKAATWRANITGVETPDPYTIIVRMKQVDFGFPSDLSSRTSVGMVSKKYVEAVGEAKASDAPIGTGSYKFSEHKLGQYMKYEAVPNNWRVGTPDFQYIVFKAMPEETTRVNALLAGEVDAIPISIDSISRVKQAGLKVVGIPEASTSYMAFGGIVDPKNKYYDPKNPFLNKDVRQALNLAVNRKEILATIYQGQAAAGTGQFLADGWRDIPTPPYDPEKAKQLLAAAGYSNLAIPIKYHLQTPDMKPMSEAVAQYWQAIGVKVTLVPSEYSTLRTVVGEGNSSGWTFPFSMPGYYFDQYERLMTLQLDPDKLGGYYTAIDPSLYTLVRKLYGNLDIADRTAVSKSVMKAMADGYWIVPIAVPDTNWALGKRVSSWSPVKTLYASMWETLTRTQ